MAKKKEKKTQQVVVGDGTKVVARKRNDILDTSAGPLVLDLTVKDEEKIVEGVLNLNAQGTRNNITVSFRIKDDVFKWAKKIALELSLKSDEDINWQKLMTSTFLEKFPMEKK